MRVTVFDYGAGNLHSLAKALDRAGASVNVETDPTRCLDGDALVLPGVGAFPQAARQLEPGREAMRSAIREGLPTLGVCLGMQLLFGESDEGLGRGLDLIDGRVERLVGSRVPQIGWGTVEPSEANALSSALPEFVYYAHSFIARPVDTECVAAWSSHEDRRFPAIVRKHRALGVQFHPEKSSAPGIAFLEAALAEITR